MWGQLSRTSPVSETLSQGDSTAHVNSPMPSSCTSSSSTTSCSSSSTSSCSYSSFNYFQQARKNITTEPDFLSRPAGSWYRFGDAGGRFEEAGVLFFIVVPFLRHLCLWCLVCCWQVVSSKPNIVYLLNSEIVLGMAAGLFVNQKRKNVFTK